MIFAWNYTANANNDAYGNLYVEGIIIIAW